MTEVTRFLKSNRLVFGTDPPDFAGCETLAEAWQTCRRADYMLLMLQCAGCENEAGLRLFTCWCAEQVLDVSADERLWHAVRTAERFARRQAGPEELAAARESAKNACLEEVLEHPQAAWIAVESANDLAYDAAMNACSKIIEGIVYMEVWDQDSQAQDRAYRNTQSLLADKLREIMGNPFTRSLPYLEKQSRTRTLAAAGAVLFAVGGAATALMGDLYSTAAFVAAFAVSMVVVKRGALV